MKMANREKSLNDVLLTVSGVIDPHIGEQIACGERPEADYVRLGRVLGADLLDYTAARQVSGRTGRLLERIGGPNLNLAWASFCLRHRYRVVFSDGEQVGIPLASMLKFLNLRARPAHLMIGHVLSVGKKMVFLDGLQVQSHIDTFFVYSTWQKRFIETRWKIPPDRVVFTPFMVDADFFSPPRARQGDPLGLLPAEKPIVCSVGMEYRDYPTLLDAVQNLDVKVVVAAASPWSKRSDSTAGQSIPKNVIVRRFSQYDLRDLYAASRFMVMPLYPVNFQAGVTAILEAMAMGKAVICTCTPGQSDIVVEGQTGIYVPPENAESLRTAIQHLLDRPDEAERMGKNGRERVLQGMDLDSYAERLKYYTKSPKNQ